MNVAAAATVSMAAHSGSNYNVLNVSSLTISGLSSALASANSASYTAMNTASQSQSVGVLTDTGRALAQATATSAIEPASPEAVPEPNGLGLLLAGASALLGVPAQGQEKRPVNRFKVDPRLPVGTGWGCESIEVAVALGALRRPPISSAPRKWMEE